MRSEAGVASRREIAMAKAAAALRALESRGLRAWVIGSLAKGRFDLHSDVDFLVDCDKKREYDAYVAIEKAMGDFPFDMVPFRRLREDAIPDMIEGALSASDLIAR
jgi:predicted nucleotidyltransferase